MERDFAMTKRKRKVSLYSPVHKHEPEGRSSVGPHSTSCMYRSRASKMYCALRMRTQGCFYVGPRVGSHRIIAAYKYMYNVHVFFLVLREERLRYDPVHVFPWEKRSCLQA